VAAEASISDLDGNGKVIRMADRKARAEEAAFHAIFDELVRVDPTTQDIRDAAAEGLVATDQEPCGGLLVLLWAARGTPHFAAANELACRRTADRLEFWRIAEALEADEAGSS
jgi:hypothetical protein